MATEASSRVFFSNIVSLIIAIVSTSSVVPIDFEVNNGLHGHFNSRIHARDPFYGHDMLHRNRVKVKNVVYSMGQTVATVTYANNGEMLQCYLYDVGTERQKDSLLRSLPSPPTSMDLHQMINMVDTCQHVLTGRQNRAYHRSRSSPTQYFNIFSGIMPGTKWCGHNNIARNYEDLGSNVDVDKCCRAHDHCPLKIQPLTKKYGMFNLGLYTKSHCMCDRMFYKCLKNSKNRVATFVGNVFFNIIGVKCVAEKFSQSCLKERIMRTGERVCEHWGYREGDRHSLKIVSQSAYY